MRKRKVSLIAPLLAFAVWVTADCNAQISANSCSFSDVQTAVKSAGRGASVTVPAGKCTWNNILTLSAGITLAGAGVGNTVITSSVGTGSPNFGSVIDIAPDSTAIANDEHIAVTGFTLDGNNTAPRLINIEGAADSGAKPFKNLIIGNNKFQNMGSVSGASNGAIYVDGGQVRGVIYANTFDRCDIVLRPMGSDTTTEWSNTAYNKFSYGSPDNLYFEDNTILYSSAYTSQDQNPGWIESGQGGRVVVRYNTWNLNNLSGQQEFWDIHGFQNFFSTPNGDTGTMLVEYYGNVMTNGASTVYRWINHRGSWGLFFDNSYSGASTPEIDVDQYDGGCTNQIVPAPGNYTPIVNNTYVFNNTVNGTLTNMIPGSVNACGVTENTNFWNYNASCTGAACTAGIGRGSTAPTGTCTTGVGYWVAPTATPNTSSSVVQSGSFYKCVNNAWARYYTPYAYPHPLRGTSSPPTPPANASAVPR